MHHYALSYTPLRGVHMRRVPPLGGARRRALRSAAAAVLGAAAFVGVYAAGAALDAHDARRDACAAPAAQTVGARFIAPATVAEVQP